MHTKKKKKHLVEIMVWKKKMGHLAKYKKRFFSSMQKAIYLKRQNKNTIINIAIWKIKPDMPQNNVTGQYQLHKIQNTKKYTYTSKNMK